ncbi:MAG: glycosyltransferase family 2 protein [Deltaproteobacteria bacterium]|nr:glycosyltransferase family 2 protein [Deltaproteobacteria bacterium]
MKLVIQIPCLDEEETLPRTLAALPRQVRGFDEVEVLVIDDGSRDATADVARAHGVHEVVRFPNHQGLARAFAAGLDHALQRGADVIVNTDADDQYDARDIEALVQPILRGEADMVVGDRDPSRLAHFSVAKRALQGLGSWAVRQLSSTTIPDATSGFRAVSRAAALKINVLSDFTYTLETIIQAGKKQIAVTHVPVRARPTERPSRLFSGASHYIRRSVATLLRMYAFYEPFKFFFLMGGVLIAASTLIGIRFLYNYVSDGGAGHIQSLILAGALLMIGAVTWLFGVLADLVGRNRQLSEEILLRMRRLELRAGSGPEARGAPPREDEAAPRRVADRRPR